MIRNLKVLIAAAMALAAFGAISASGAQAAEFHCSVEPCTITIQPDGSVPSKTAHHVFVTKKGGESVSFTCNQVTGDATSETKTTKTLTIGSIAYDHCTTSGQAFNIRMNGCEYHLVTPGATHDASSQIKCPEGKVIELEIPATKCLVTIGTTAVLGGGFEFHDPETGGIKKTELTAEPAISNIPVTIGAGCPIAAGLGSGEYTTGNVELTGETTGGAHASVWGTA